nr:DUF2254 family protein [Salsipaludibacter albus]
MRRAELRDRLSDNLLLRPVLFVSAGILVAWLALTLDDVAPGLLPTGLQFGAESARLLYVTLAGALLTVAGLTFWVRSASVSLAASQYSARVVSGFLEDFYQQSMMSIMLGLFAYVVTVYRALPVGRETSPHFAVLLGIVLAAGSIVVVMGAIRNAVRSMYPGQLARSITDVTLARIRTFSRRQPAHGARTRSIREQEIPSSGGVYVRASHSGFVQSIDEAAILAALPSDATLLLRVRVGLFVIEGRPLLRIWSDEPVDVSALAQAVRMGRTRVLALDAEYGLQQLVDIAVGSLSNHGDVASAFEVLQHIEMVLRELARRDLGEPVTETDDGIRILRERAYTYDDYVKLAFDRFRRAAAPYPSALAPMMSTAAQLAQDLRRDGRHGRAAVLRDQITLVLATAEHHPEIVGGDLERLRERARRLLAELEDLPETTGPLPAAPPRAVEVPDDTP